MIHIHKGWNEMAEEDRIGLLLAAKRDDENSRAWLAPDGSVAFATEGEIESYAEETGDDTWTDRSETMYEGIYESIEVTVSQETRSELGIEHYLEPELQLMVRSRLEETMDLVYDARVGFSQFDGIELWDASGVPIAPPERVVEAVSAIIAETARKLTSRNHDEEED